MTKKPIPKHRSGCPVSVALEVFGDRWSLILVRDLMVRGYRTFGEMLRAGEGIATNILADRLKRLEEADILYTEPSDDGRSAYYRLTEKGISLAPVLLELLIWATHHEDTASACNVIAMMEQDRAGILAETRRRWEQRDTTPLLPPIVLTGGATTGNRRAARKTRTKQSTPAKKGHTA